MTDTTNAIRIKVHSIAAQDRVFYDTWMTVVSVRPCTVPGYTEFIDVLFSDGVRCRRVSLPPNFDVYARPTAKG